jgi:hypothetical protein
MRDFPFDACPTAIDLFAYSHGRLRQDDLPRYERIEAHVQDCFDCRRALDALHEVPEAILSQGTGRSAPQDPLLQAIIDAQREALAGVLASEHDTPAPGDVWVTRYAMDWLPGEELPWMGLVTDHYWREYTCEWVLDIVPVTEDADLAADWSYVVPEDRSDFGAALVAHIDFLFTAPRAGVLRRVGRLADVCFGEVQSTRKALLSGGSVGELRCGRLGTASMRSRDEWLRLEEALYSLIQQATVAFGDQANPTAVECIGQAETDRPECLVDPPIGPSGGSGVYPSFVPAKREFPTTPFPVPGQTGTEGYEIIPINVSGYCEDPDQGAAPPDAHTFGALLDRYLDDRFGGDLRNWFSAKGHSVPEDTEYLWRIRLPDGVTLDGATISKHLKRETGKPVDMGLLRLLNEAVQFDQTRRLAQEGLGKRAARRQDPGHEHRP